MTFHPHRSIASITLAILLALSFLEGSALHADPGSRALFELLPDAATSPANHPVVLDRSLVESDPESISIPLPDGRTFEARRSVWRWQSSDSFHWFGELQDASGTLLGGTLSLVSTESGLLGTLRTPDGSVYRVSEKGGESWLREVAGAGRGCEVGAALSEAATHEHRPYENRPYQNLGESLTPAGSSLSSDVDCVAPADTTFVDVMVLYPLSLASQAQAVEAYAAAKVQEARSLFSLSGVKVSYRLAHTGPITGEQPPPPSPYGNEAATRPVLEWLNAQFATPAIDTEVEMLRRAHGADFVVAVIPGHPNTNCGIANLPILSGGQEVLYGAGGAFTTKAFAVVEFECGEADYTFAHELGHTFGMHHETPRITSNDPRAVYPWAYGYQIPRSGADDATVMACIQASDCRRIPRFSNPDKTYGGAAIGEHSSQSSTPAHNACVANLRAGHYAGFASPPPSTPPRLVITSPADGAQVTVGTAFTLASSATDAQDGDLRASVQWTSDRDGFLGTGSPLSATLGSGGDHLITATVQDSDGTLVPYSIRLVAYEPYVPLTNISSPKNRQEVSGNVLVKGWVTDTSGIVDLSFKVDGVPVTLTSFARTNRPDVCAYYSHLGDPDCPRVGYQGYLDTDPFSPGLHTLQLIATDRFGNRATRNRSFRKVTSQRVFASHDAHVSEANPGANFGQASRLQVRGSGSGQALHAYLKFNVTGVVGTVRSATLKLRTGSTPLQGLRIYWMQSSSWNEGSITWNNASQSYYFNFPTSAHPANSNIEIDVGSIVSGNGTYTIGLVAPDAPGQELVSSENTFFGPELEITY